MTKSIDPTRVVTGRARSTYMFCLSLEDRSDDGDGNKCVSSGVLIPKKDKSTIRKVLKAIGAASRNKFGKEAYTKIGKAGCPLRDIDEEREDDDTKHKGIPKGMYLLNVKGYSLPGLIYTDEDGDREVVDVDDAETREELLRSGYWFKFSLKFKGYEHKAKKGVRVELQNIFFLEKDERLDGGLSADQENWDDDDYADEEDDESEAEARRRRRKARKKRRKDRE